MIEVIREKLRDVKERSCLYVDDDVYILAEAVLEMAEALSEIRSGYEENSGYWSELKAAGTLDSVAAKLSGDAK
jgi:hypothetical protein